MDCFGFDTMNLLNVISHEPLLKKLYFVLLVVARTHAFSSHFLPQKKRRRTERHCKNNTVEMWK